MPLKSKCRSGRQVNGQSKAALAIDPALRCYRVMTESSRKSAGPQSVTRVIRLLEALCASPVPMSLADLARALGSPKSSVSALLHGLAAEGIVVAGESTWRLGPGAFGLGSALVEARRRWPVNDLVRAALRRLASASGETALYAVRDGEGETITYVDLVESASSVRFAVSPGDRRPLYATAAGRALLAASGEAALAGYLARLTPERLTGATETAKTRLAAAVTEAHAAGVAQTVDQAARGRGRGTGRAGRRRADRALAAAPGRTRRAGPRRGRSPLAQPWLSRHAGLGLRGDRCAIPLRPAVAGPARDGRPALRPCNDCPVRA
jgi:DNA-binding IclR family transcriptional regulator